jgi:signal transduction histidine kinase
MALSSFDLICEPDGMMADYPEYNRFLSRQNSLREIQDNDVVTLTTPEGKQFEISPHRSSRPWTSLPADFWVQVTVGFVAWMVSASVFIFRPRELSARYLLLSGASTLLFTTAAASYTTRELGFDGATLRWACDLNFLGGSVFAASFVALLLYYPRRIAPRWVGLAIVNLYVFWFLLQEVGVFESMTFARRFLVMIGVLATFALAGVHWWGTRRKPVERAALQWFLLSWVLGTSLFALLILLPQMFGVDTSGVQGYAFALFLLVYGGLAFGIMRFRLFEIGSWWRSIMGWTGAALVLVLLDLFFAAGLQFSTETSISLSLLICGLVWLPFRTWVWKMLSGRRKVATEERFDRILEIALHPAGLEGQQQAWMDLLREEFSPLEMGEESRERSEIEIQRHGQELRVPSLVAGECLTLTHAEGGKRLFNHRDVTNAQEMRKMLRHVTEGLDSYKKGVMQERGRIARDVHDNTMSYLLSALHQGEDEAKDEKIRGSIRELRQIINDSADEEFTLSSALDDLRRECLERAEVEGVALKWDEKSIPNRPLEKGELNVLRSVLRESLTNVFKHSGAEQASIKVDWDVSGLKLTVSDNGCGLKEGASPAGRGLGNMRFRLVELGGKMTILERKRGTQLEMTIPFAAEAVAS